MPYPVRIAPLALALALAAHAPAHAQDTVVVAGAHYAAGGLWRLIFGTEYRRLWTAPVAARVLDLHSFAGGLTPVSRGGGFQTKSLWLRGRDGYLYGFRSVDKDPEVPEGLEDTFIQSLVQDQTSSQHPGSPPVVAGLLTAAGVLHTEQQLVVIPDDPALDTFHLRFAGTLGYLERRAVVDTGRPGFAGAIEIVGGALLVVGLFSRWVAFIVAGEMAFAYFIGHAPRSFYPIQNGGNLAILYCFVFFYILFAGPGLWSVDAMRSKNP